MSKSQGSISNFLVKGHLIRRWNAASSQDGLGGFMISGGDTFGGPDKTPTTTEVYRAGRWTYGPELPRAIWDHCQVLLGDTVYITLGQTHNSTHAFKNKHSFKSKNGGDWIEVNSPAVLKDLGHTCAAHAGKMYVIGGFVGGELSSVEIFDPSSETWTFGPDLPIRTLENAQAFSWGGFLWVLGGSVHHGGEDPYPNNVIYRLDEKGWENAGSYINTNSKYLYTRIQGQIVDEDIISC